MTEQALPQIARFLSWVLFLVLGARVARTAGPTRKRAIQAFIGYTIAIHALAGVTQIDNWPFTSHTLAVGRMRGDHTLTWMIFRGVDRDGREWQIDPQSWSPIFDSILQNWLAHRYPRLDAASRRASERFLVQKANEARARLSAGQRVGFERILGPLACGYWWRLPRVRAAPDRDYRAIRVYRLEYSPAEIATYGRIVRRETLLMELDG